MTSFEVGEQMKRLLVYVHGKGGRAEEATHYRSLFPRADVVGLDYEGKTPWDTAKELRSAIARYANEYEGIDLIANSIGAYYSMNAGLDDYISKAFFISPIVDMERLILDMLTWANETETCLQKQKVIHTAFGEDLSWEYLCYVRERPIRWRAPTEILYGERDNLTSYDTIVAFAAAHHARLTVMPNGEHWFHTEEQMAFLDRWIIESR